jgi:hypothetical protein
MDERLCGPAIIYSSTFMTVPLRDLCFGCGKDHAPGAGCGYDREVRWTPYGRRESLAHVRFFPVVIGLVAAAVAIYFVARPPENPIYLYVGVGLPALVALVVGGIGIASLVTELRKKRYRVSSTDGRDRALVTLVGGELRYAFGESLKYEPVVADLEWADALSSASAFALAGELSDLVDPDLAAWLRRDGKDETLLRDATSPSVRLATMVAMGVVGLAARGDVAIWVGRYKAWGRGGGKMTKVTEGIEVALDTRPGAASADDLPFEREVLRLAAPGDESPIALDAIVDAIIDGRKTDTVLDTLSNRTRAPKIDPSAARTAWKRAQVEEAELIMRLFQHALPERPRTIRAD